jgi:predicted AAA+ superfamily ATPase
VVVVTGARQTGKTSLLQHTFPQASFVTLDVPLNAAQAEQDGEAFLARLGTPAIIDEIQYAPGLFRTLKQAVDAQRNVKGRYLITGSQRLDLLKGTSESLAGRVALLELHTLSGLEWEDARGALLEGRALWEFVHRGGYPELHAEPLDPLRFYADYFATYIARDVRDLIQVKSARDFDRFVRLLATRTGQLLSLQSLALDVGISPTTARSWLSVLEASHIVSLLEPWHTNAGKRIIKTPKLYFNDTGLVCALLHLQSADDLLDSPLRGAVFETFAFGQLARVASWRSERPRFWFYRDHDGVEIDFVVETSAGLVLAECKSSAQPALSTKAFDAFEKRAPSVPVHRRVVLSPCRERRDFPSQNLVLAPVVDPSCLFEKASL